MIAKQELDIQGLTESYNPGQIGSPTKAEVMALVQVYRGQIIPDHIIDAVLTTTRSENHEDVLEMINAWNTCIPQEPRFREVKKKLGQNLTVGLLANLLCKRGSGLIDTSKLIRIQLRSAMMSEVSKLIEEGKL